MAEHTRSTGGGILYPRFESRKGYSPDVSIGSSLHLDIRAISIHPSSHILPTNTCFVPLKEFAGSGEEQQQRDEVGDGASRRGLLSRGLRGFMSGG